MTLFILTQQPFSTPIINSVIIATESHHLQPSFNRTQPPQHTLMPPGSTKTTPQAAVAVHSSNNNNEQWCLGNERVARATKRSQTPPYLVSTDKALPSCHCLHTSYTKTMPQCHVASHSNPTSTHQLNIISCWRHGTSIGTFQMCHNIWQLWHKSSSPFATETTTTNDDAWEVGEERRMPFRQHALLYLFLLYIDNTPVDYPSWVSYPPNPHETRTR